ncbi:hypothetical protein AB0D49_08090 [Streptomyces sp. NPDC048290]|uniref:hypothetical protein n=1 Tax=Streptomyces sp. NPDC048290 TaxID=3155811 RepID=UPI00343EBB5C
MASSDRPDDREQLIAELRLALEKSVRLLSFAAGREAAGDPDEAAKMLGEVDRLKAVLERTAP